MKQKSNIVPYWVFIRRVLFENKMTRKEYLLPIIGCLVICLFGCVFIKNDLWWLSIVAFGSCVCGFLLGLYNQYCWIRKDNLEEDEEDEDLEEDKCNGCTYNKIAHSEIEFNGILERCCACKRAYVSDSEQSEKYPDLYIEE